MRLAAAEEQRLSPEQTARVLDLDTAGDPLAQQLRKGAVRSATREQLTDLFHDADPAVARLAHSRLQAMTVLSDDPRDLSTEAAWRAAAAREIDAEIGRARAADERDRQWWFDRAWEERQALLGTSGARPAGPDVQVAAAAVDRAAAELAQCEAAAAMLPVWMRVPGLQDAIRRAEQRYGAAQQAQQALAAQLDAGEHPAQIAQREWDAAHGDGAGRLAELDAQCLAGLAELAKEHADISEMPTSPVAQAMWLEMNGEYAAAKARMERTGRVLDRDVEATIAHRQAAAELGSVYARGGYVDAADVAVDRETAQARYNLGY